MLDINFIRENSDKIKKVCQAKGIALDVNKLLSLDKNRRKLIKESESLRFEQKKLGKEDREKAKKIKDNFKNLDVQLKEIKKEYQELMLLVPNIYSNDTPVGKDEKGNKEAYKWGKIPKFNFPIKNHIQLVRDLDLADFEKGAKVSGFRGCFLKNELAFLQMALIMYSVQKIVNKGFELMIPPTLLKEFALIGSGHFPTGKEDVYQVANPGKLADGKPIKEPLFLAGTSEPPLLAYFSDSVFKEKDLPIKVSGFSQCYRSEIGSYGKDTKGLYRLHEFMKVEHIVLCRNDNKESDKWLEKMKENSEEIVKDLKLPYRVLQICTGDMGDGKRKMYDIETWIPSRNTYGETHSASNMSDWQPRRLNIKYKTSKGEIKYVHALNDTVIACPRILISLLECYQQKDGSVKIPKVLQKYLGLNKITNRNVRNK
jgi:seryl-tRNA synthetase